MCECNFKISAVAPEYVQGILTTNILSPACLQSRDTMPDTFPPAVDRHAIIFVHLSLPWLQKREEEIFY